MMQADRIIDFLEQAVQAHPDKRAVVDQDAEYTYAQLHEVVLRAASALLESGASREHGVIVLADKSFATLACMLGALYAGSFYVPVEPISSVLRLNSIIQTLDAPLIVYDEAGLELLQASDFEGKSMSLDALLGASLSEAAVNNALACVTEEQPAYIMFTSGSTGTPKGVMVSRESVAGFISAFVDAFEIAPDDIIANQAPFDFDVSVKDIYGTLASGATLLIIPRRLFSAPAELIDYLIEHEATVMIWAVAALCMLVSLHALDGRELPLVRRVLFSGEVMPVDFLRKWMEKLPHAEFVNLYGPTEVTCNCTYHIVDRDRDYSDGIPIGVPFAHREVFLVDDEGRAVETSGAIGEIIVGGASLALGYVGAGEKDNQKFCKNPLSDNEGDRVYRTGDSGRLTEDGEIIFAGRRDNQIKHLGHRIELEEIDSLMELSPLIERCRCSYDYAKKRIIAFIEGDATAKDARMHARSIMVPAFMPAKYVQVETMPLTKNGKVDRAALLKSLEK